MATVNGFVQCKKCEGAIETFFSSRWPDHEGHFWRYTPVSCKCFPKDAVTSGSQEDISEQVYEIMSNTTMDYPEHWDEMFLAGVSERQAKINVALRKGECSCGK